MASIALLGSGCSGHRDTTPNPTPRRAVPGKPAAWRGVINDWYANGITHRHSCAAVRAALAHLPVDFGASKVRVELQRYARTVCHVRQTQRPARTLARAAR